MKNHFLTPVALVVFMALSGIVDAAQWGGGTSLNYQLNQLNQINQMNQLLDMQQQIAKQKKARVSPATTHTGQSKHQH